MPRNSNTAKDKKTNKKTNKEKKKEDNAREKVLKEDNQKDQEKQKPKFKFDCQLCGKCCETINVNITITDLDRWVADNTIYRVFHLLTMDDSEGGLRLVLKKDDDGFCSLYHRDNKKCTIYASRPLICQAYPLGFNGENYLLKSTDCIGLNKGKMTKEQLEKIRNHAFDEYIATRLSERVLPTLHQIFVAKLIEQSRAFMDKLADSDEEGEKVEKG